MLTLFTAPKPFLNHFKNIQRNAIHSWTLLKPACEIILFGDDEGTAEVAAEFKVQYVPDIARNEYGTPLVNDLFEKAQCLTDHNIFCYINADIILMSSFMRAVEQVISNKKHFLMVGQRWDADIREPLDFGTDWEERVRGYVTENGQLHHAHGIDYFVFSRGLWGEIPPFAIGRTTWDNWLIYQARTLKVPVIDVTPVVMAIHQNHDYSHRKGGKEEIWRGPEARRNLELADKRSYNFQIRDATYRLTPEGLKKQVLKGWHIRQFLETSSIAYPQLRLPIRLLLKIIDLSYPIRIRLKLILNSGDTHNA